MSKNRGTIYKSLEPGVIKDLYESPDTARKVLDIAKENDLSESQTTAFSQIVGDAILGIYTLDDIPGRFEQSEIPSEEAFALTNAVRDLLAPIRSENDAKAHIEPASFQQITPDTNPPTAPDTLQQEPAIAPKAAEQTSTSTPETPSQPTETQQPNGISELRTMQGDAERIHGYGAYRRRMREKEGLPPDEEKDSSQLADVPKYSND